jgi:hypothetical protein
MKLEKDQRVWVVFPNYSKNYPSEGTWATIIKAGSKYATALTDVFGREFKFNRVVFEQNYHNRSITETNYPALIYESEAAWLEERRQNNLRDKFNRFCHDFQYNRTLPIEKIEKILEILEIKAD